MSRSCHIKVIALAGLFSAVIPASGADSTRLLPPSPPAVPAVASRIDYFRQLFAAQPAERELLLAGKTPEQRQVLLNSLREYEALSVHERELRLLALELRLHLYALMRQAPTNRSARLAVVPDSVLPLVRERLHRWDQYNATEQAALLENEKAVRAILSLDQGSPGTVARPTPQQLSQIEKDIARWKELPPEQQQRIYEHFQTIFELRNFKEDRAFEKLNEAERQQIEKTLATFRQLPKIQRDICISNFHKFADMSPVQRRQFLVDAGMWSQMMPEERQLWRDLVKRVPPLPPLPPGFDAPPSPRTTRLPNRPVMAGTN